jgi:ribonuclease E
VTAESVSSEVVPDTLSPVDEVNAEVAAGEAEEKPKRRRQPRRKAGSATRVEAAPSDGTDEQTPAAPKPRRRRRPAKARDAAATAAPETAPEPAPAGEPATPPDAPADYVASARTEAPPPLAADSADGPAFGDIPPNGEDDDGKPRRKGWWQRWI